jgi:hypothetical protein
MLEVRGPWTVGEVMDDEWSGVIERSREKEQGLARGIAYACRAAEGLLGHFRVYVCTGFLDKELVDGLIGGGENGKTDL